MPCLSNYTLKGMTYDCRANLAGVKRIYLAYWGDVQPLVDFSTQEISAYTMSEGAEWLVYDFPRGAASLTSALNRDDATGNRSWTHTISVTFNKMQASSHMEMMGLAGERLCAVVVTNNGDSWFVGLDGYLGTNSQEAGTGVGAEDRNGYSISMDCNSRWMPFKFTADIENPSEEGYINISVRSSSIVYDGSIIYTSNTSGDYTLVIRDGDTVIHSATYSGGTNITQIAVPENDTDQDKTLVMSFALVDDPTITQTINITQKAEDAPVPPAPVEKYVQDLIDEGYATYVTGNGGTYISILSACPYSASQIVDLQEVATNQKKLSGNTNNIIIWDQPKPSGWTDNDIAQLYSGQTLNFTPRAHMLWALGNIPNFEITFAGGSYQVNDYPWGTGQNNNGVFAPRYQTGVTYPDYFRESPTNVVVNFTGDYGTIAQTMFAEMGTTTAITLSGGHFFTCVDWTGWFEDCYDLVTLNFNLLVRYDFTRLCHNMFKNCQSLTGVPYVVAWGRDHAQNTIFPHTQEGGSADCAGMFVGCSSLKTFGPTMNLANVSLNGCVVDGQQQSALSGLLFECPELTDVRLKNIGWNSWNFTNTSTYTYIPKMDVASIEYLLNNVQDVTGNNYSLTFSTLHQGEISSSALTNAQNKGWTVLFA